MARKKARTAKQKAADNKNGARLKRMNAAKRKGPKRRASPKRKAAKRRAAPKRKTNKRKKAPKRQMAGKKNFVSKTFSNPTLKKVLMAAGAVSVATTVAAIAVPSLVPTLQRPIVKAVLGFAAGDVIGGASQFLLSGGIGSLGLGGSNGNTNTSNAGFA